MDAERPRGAPLPHEFPGHQVGDVEAEQMEAFEQGVERWWLVVPPRPEDDPDEWRYAGEDGA